METPNTLRQRRGSASSSHSSGSPSEKSFQQHLNKDMQQQEQQPTSSPAKTSLSPAQSPGQVKLLEQRQESVSSRPSSMGRVTPLNSPRAASRSSPRASSSPTRNVVTIDDQSAEKPQKSIGDQICGAIRGLWQTRETEDFVDDEEGFVKTTLRELIVYVLFILVLTLLTFGMVDSTQFYFTKVMSDLFLETSVGESPNLKEASTITDVWQFMRGPLLDGIYWEKWYNNQPVEEHVFILHESKLLGIPRIRQLKVRNDSCNIHEDFRLEISECFGDYYEEGEDKEAFGLGLPRTNLTRDYAKNIGEWSSSSSLRQNQSKEMLTTTISGEWSCWPQSKVVWPFCQSLTDPNELTKKRPYVSSLSAWNYISADDIDGSTHAGKFFSYGGGGFVQDLGLTKSESAEMVEELFNHRWIDRATRALFVDFTVYNANINLFCQIRLLAEFPSTGGASTSWEFRTVKLLRYVTTSDYVIMGCEVVFCFFILYYIVEEAIEVKRNKVEYFKSFWNWLDIIVISISVVCIAFNVLRTIKVGSILDGLIHKPDSFPDFEFLGYWQKQFNNIIAVAVFFSWIKIFKYISFNKTMNQLSSTLSRCAKDVAGFTLMFFIVFLAFVQLAYLVFGTQVKDFSTIPGCIFTQLRIILGDFDFEAIETAHGVIGPIYFFSYIFFVFFVLMNMFLAIINDTYAEVKGDQSQNDAFRITDYFKLTYGRIIHKLGKKRERIEDIQAAAAAADADGDKKIDFEEWRTELRRRGHADEEIRALFEKYDQDGDKVLSYDERQRMLKDLEGKKDDIDAEMNDQRNQMENHKASLNDGGNLNLNSDDDDDDNDDDGDSASIDLKSMTGVSPEEFQLLNRRVDRMESSVGSIVSKIDGVLTKLESMEKVKVKRRETMGKLLQAIGGERIKREEMERLVRDELQSWDSETSLENSSTKTKIESKAGNERDPADEKVGIVGAPTSSGDHEADC